MPMRKYLRKQAWGLQAQKTKALHINAETLVEMLFILYMRLSVKAATVHRLWKGKSSSQLRLGLFPYRSDRDWADSVPAELSRPQPWNN